MFDLRPFETVSFVALRIITGLMFGVHGVQKVLGILANEPAEFGTQIWAGGLIELVGGVCIALGLLTRPFALLASGTMALAYSGPAHRYRLLNRMIIKALHESGLMEALG